MNRENITAALTVPFIAVRDDRPLHTYFTIWPTQTLVHDLAKKILKPEDLPIDADIPFLIEKSFFFTMVKFAFPMKTKS